MSFRIKLTLFTVGFVLLASLAILGVSVFQSRQRERRDIQTLRTSELTKLKNNLQSSVDIICAVEDRVGPPEMSANLEGIISRLKKRTLERNANWIWVLDTNGNSGQPVLLSSPNDMQLSMLSGIPELIKIARNSGNTVIESSPPGIVASDTLIMSQSHLYWYAQALTTSGWVLAAGAPLSSLDSAVAQRTLAVKAEIAGMIKDRMLFSLLLIIASAVAIFVFSKIISDPIKRLVNLTESIAQGRKGFADRITIASHDEIGRLAASFNELLKHVQDSMTKLEETAGKYRELVENANSAIIRLDGNGKVLFINEYAHKLFGHPPSEVEGRNIAETIGKPVKAPTAGADMFQAPEKYPYLEREHLTARGQRIWVGWTNRSIVDKDGRLVETLCVGGDITKSKEAEELAALQRSKLIQADKMATLGILVSGVAHEINNPNNYIGLNAQSLLDMWRDMAPVLGSYARENPDYAVAGLAYQDLSKEIPGMLKGISDGANRIKAIVQSLKDFSRMEPDDMTQKIDMAKLLESAQIIVGNLIKKTTDNFTVALSPDLPPVRGNFQRIEQVVINLLTNACQATDDPAKPVAVSVDYRREAKEMVVCVSDRGRGIDPKDLKRVFDPFFTTKRDEGGTGLGLAVSYSIVKDHGGDLRLDSALGKGTVATLILPVF
jgi:PAS domain S-box-containing protein